MSHKRHLQLESGDGAPGKRPRLSSSGLSTQHDSVSNTEKTRILHIQLSQLSDPPPRGSLSKLAPYHHIHVKKTDELLAAFQSHTCTWRCTIPEEARELLPDEVEEDEIFSRVYNIALNDQEKETIFQAMLTSLFEEMSKARRRALFNEHGLRTSDKASEEQITLKEHHCSSQCRMRIQDVHWFRQRTVHTRAQENHRDTHGSRDRQRQHRLRLQEEAEELRERENEYWEKNWPQTESLSTLKEILQESCDACSSKSMQYEACSFCDAYENVKSMKRVDKCRVDTSLLEANIQIMREQHPQSKIEAYRHTDSAEFMFCDACWRQTKVAGKRNHYCFKKVPLFSWANGCWIGQVPSELQGLTYVEELVIAKAHTTRCWAKINLTGHKSNPMTRQRAASGNVCIHPHDITNVATQLPRPINTLYDEIAVVFVRNDRQATASVYEKTPLLARRGRILAALRWLKDNNPLYADIQIDYDTLKEYSENGEVPFPARFHSRSEIPAGESTTYSGHGIDKVEDLLENTSGDFDADVPISRSGSCDLNRTEMSMEARKLEALRFIKANGRFLKTSTRDAPISTYDTPQVYAFLWPTLFPYGVGYFDDSIRQKPGFKRIPTALHVRHLLRISDRRFQVHLSFIFVMHNLLVRRRSSHEVKVAVKRAWWSRAMKILNCVDTSTFSNMKESMLRKRADKDFSPYDPKSKEEKDVLQLLKFVSFVDNHIEGSIGEVGKLREELRAISRYCGTPSIFLTINPADAHHPLTSYLAGTDIQLDKLFDNPDSRYSSMARARTLANNPIAGAKFFEFMIKRFIDIFLGCSRSSGRGVFGRVKFYYGCVEAQNRGSLHIHMLIWLEGADSPKQIQERCKNDPNYQHRLFEWLESIIKLSMPANTNARPPGTYDEARRSILGQPPQPNHPLFEERWPNYLREVLECSGQHHSHGDVCFKKCRRSASSMTPEEQDEACRFNLPAEVVPFTVMDDDGKIHIKREDPMMVGYNPTISGGNQCNTDVKFVGSGRLGMAMATYMSNYTAKSTLDSAIVMTALCAAIASLEEKHNGRVFTEEEDQCQLLLLKTLNQMTARRELSAQQVASSLLGIPNHFTNACFVRVYWSSVLSFLSADNYPIRRENSDKETTEGENATTAQTEMEDPEELIVINAVPEESDVLPPSRSPIYDVLYRPNELEEMSWWDLLSFYKKVTIASADTKLNSNEKEDDPKPLVYLRFQSEHPEYHTHLLQKRKRQHIPVLIGCDIPKRGPNEDPNEVSDKYAVAMLALFRPWKRTMTSPLKDENQTWNNAFSTWFPSLNEDKKKLMRHFEEIWECREAADDYSAIRRKKAFESPIYSRRRGTDDTLTYEDPIFRFAQLDQEGDETEWDQNFSDEDISLICSDRTMDQVEKILFLAKLGSLYSLPKEGLSLTYDPSSSTHMVEPDDRISSTIARETLMTEKEKKKLERKAAMESRFANGSFNETPSRTTEPRNTTLQEEIRRYEHKVANLPTYKRRAWGNLHEWQKLAIVICEKFTLNKEQKQAFLTIVDHRIRKNKHVDLSPLRLIIGGPGGSGKSHIYDAVRSFYEAIGRSYELMFTAPTGVAADGLEGSTIHSFLYLNMQYSRLCEPNNKGRNELSERLAIVKTLVIDEVYFVSCGDFEKVSRNIKLGMGFTDDSFGKLDIIVSGDQFQLACPFGQPLFSKDYALSHGQRSRTQGQSDLVKQEMRGFSAFREFSDCVILKQILRQKNPRYVEFINRLRWGICTTSGPDNDLDYIRKFCIENSSNGVSAVFGADVRKWITNPSSAAPLVTYTNAVRDVHNWEMVKCFSAATNQDFKVYYAEDYTQAQSRGDRVILTGQNAIAAWNTPPKQNIDDLAGRLPLAVGMPVILVENIAVELGLCKSTRGTLVSVRYFIRNGKRYVVSAEVHFPSYKDEKGSHLITIPTIRRSFEYEVHGTKLKARREQIPLIPGFAFTIHNSQSQTLDAMIAHLDSARGTAAAYVIMSRIKCGESGQIQLRIIGDFEPEKICTHAAPQVRNEEERLLQLAANTAKRFKDSKSLEWYQITTGDTVF